MCACYNGPAAIPSIRHRKYRQTAGDGIKKAEQNGDFSGDLTNNFRYRAA